MNWVQTIDGLGRPLGRIAGVVILVMIGVAIAIQFWMWALFNRPPADVPVQGIFIAALPYVIQTVQEFTRSAEKRSLIHANAPSVNPHGGPAAP